MWNITKDCTGMRTKRPIKDGIGGPVGSRNHAVQQHNKYENKWKKELKYLKKQKIMLYSIAKKSGSCRESQKIKNTRKEALKDTYSSSEDWDSNSYLASDSSRDKEIWPSGSKEINKLDHVVTKNIKDYNYQYNFAIDDDTTLANISFNLSRSTRDPLPVVTVSLRGGNKHRATVVAGLTCLWDS